MKLLLCLLTLGLLMGSDSRLNAGPDKPVRARYLITVADDFVVEVHHNGQLVPRSQRQLLDERFGATAERMNLEVRAGDWLVFNVVNNSMRWDGVSYFGVAGCLQENSFGFVSTLDKGGWSVCDTPGDVDRFITQKEYFMNHPAQPIAHVWQDGDGLMHKYAGDSWSGVPVWGSARNTWIKVQVK